MIKRIATAALAVAFAAALVAPLGGCESGASNPRDLKLRADKIMKANWKAVGEVSVRTDSLISWLGGALDAGSGIDEGGFDEEAEAMRVRIRSIHAGYKDAMKDYQRITQMKKAGAYGDYAKLKTLEIDAATSLINDIDGFLISTTEKMSRSGPDAGEFKADADEYKKQFDRDYAKTVKLAGAAEALKM